MSRLNRIAYPLVFALLLAVAALAAEGKPARVAPPTGPAASPAPAEAAPPEAPPETVAPEEPHRRPGDKVVFGTSLNVPADEVVVGSVVCIGCRGRIDGKVLREIVVVGGKVDIAGSVVGQLVAVATKVELEPDASIGGDVINVGGRVKREDRQVRHCDPHPSSPSRRRRMRSPGGRRVRG